jgi:hypothetical protein
VVNGTHQLLGFPHDVDESIHTIKTEALIVASKEIGLEANAENT